MKAKNLISVLMVILLLLPLVSADLIPTTAPCWYTGTVNSTDITVEGLTVEAYKGSTLLKSSTITGGVYDLNSIGANDGDTIDLKVYGATFATSTFVGYCRTGSDPWVVEDFNVSKQANGVSCSNGAICTSGTCTSNVCADPSSGGGGGGGNSNTVNTNTSTTNSNTNTNTPNTGSGSSSNLVVVIDVPGVDTIAERNELVSEVSEALDVNTDQVTEIEQESVTDLTSDFTVSKEQTEEEVKSIVSANVLNVVKTELDKYENVQVSITTKVKVMKVTKKDGTVQKVTKVEKEITVSSKDIKGDTVRVIEVIPKEVAASAAKLSGDFIVLEDDPVLAFDVPLSSVVNGKVKVDYTISGDVLQSSLNKIVTSVVDKTTPVFSKPVVPVIEIPKTNEDKAVVNPVDTAVDTNSENGSMKLYVSIIVVLILIVIAGFFILSKKKKSKFSDNKFDGYIARTYSYSSNDPNYIEIKDYIERYKHEYSKELLVEALRKAKFSEILIRKVLSEEYVLNKNSAYYMPNTYTYSSNDPNYIKIKDYIEKYKYEYSKEKLVEALRKEKFPENLIKKVLSEEYK